MRHHVLITGGAGFIGSHLADRLLAQGHRVRVLDRLCAQVHGADSGGRPAYLAPEVEIVEGDVADRSAVDEALAGIDVVYHFAARVGVGQSMYEIAEYTRANNLGTAVLLEAIASRAKQPGQRLARLVVASSMSIYGEGLYRTRGGELVEDAARTHEQLRRGAWAPTSRGRGDLEPVPTAEWKRPALASVYALSKYDQEQLCLMIGRAYGIATVALRFFNAYGTRQALSNPYTGVLAIFAARLLNGKPPLIFEDGEQRRDFVSVHDIARACTLALSRDEAVDEVINVGSGRASTVREIAERMAQAVRRPDIAPEITGQHRVGDIRHCFADIAKARRLLGYEPQVALEDGLAELAAWLKHQHAVDRVGEMKAQLVARGLAI